MRRIFSSSTGPRFVMSEEGLFKELSTGTGSYAEHNCPESRLEFELLDKVRYEGEKPTEREIFEGLRIAHGDKIQFQHLTADAQNRPQAVLGFISYKEQPGIITRKRLIDDEDVLKELNPGFDDQDIVAALAYGNFAIKVRGDALVNALKHFYEAIQAGTVYLAPGSRLKSSYGWSFGLTMVNMAILSEQEREQMPLHVMQTVRRERRMYLYGW